MIGYADTNEVVESVVYVVRSPQLARKKVTGKGHGPAIDLTNEQQSDLAINVLLARLMQIYRRLNHMTFFSRSNPTCPTSILQLTADLICSKAVHEF
jgi:hypothetical protein